MNRLSTNDRARVLACLVEGASIRRTVRITGICKRTVSRLVIALGDACQQFAAQKITGLKSQKIQCDEVWSFIGCKAKNLKPELHAAGWGDAWTWTAFDPISKLVAAWHVGDRSALTAYRFMRQLEPRLTERVELTTDGHTAYLVAVKAAFLARGIDYGTLVKLYGEGESGKYSPTNLAGTQRKRVMGLPVLSRLCTSHVERNNLTVRMQMRRFTRLTNGFSKSLTHHKAAVNIHFVHYNFCRIHSSIRITPAMAAGLTDHVWELSELIALLEAQEVRLAA